MRKFRHDGSADHKPSRDECGSSAWLLVMSSRTHSCNQGYSKHQEPKAHMVTGRNVMIYLIHMQECYKTVLFLVSVCERGRSFITKLSGGSWSHMGPENIKVGVISGGKKKRVCVCVFLPWIWLDVRCKFSSSQEKIAAICHPYKIALLIHPLSFLQASLVLFPYNYSPSSLLSTRFLQVDKKLERSEATCNPFRLRCFHITRSQQNEARGPYIIHLLLQFGRELRKVFFFILYVYVVA